MFDKRESNILEDIIKIMYFKTLDAIISSTNESSICFAYCNGLQ